MLVTLNKEYNLRFLLFVCILIAATTGWATTEMEPSTAVVGALENLARVQDYEARRNSSSHEELHSNGDARSIEPGGTLVLMDEKGPGIITHFWNTIASYDTDYARSVVLRIYYDGMEAPSVETPLGDFFGVGNAMEREFTSLPVATSSNGRSRVCYWQMPFRESIKVTVSNDNTDREVDSFYYYLSWRKLESLPEETPYFHARYRQEYPAKPGNYQLLQTEGKGHYVGTVLSVLQMETGWFGEGDDFFYIDGAELPQLRGTGTEDYFNDSWGFREFSKPYYGVPVYEGVLLGDRVSAYRWHIPDPIPFKTSLHAEIEHRGSVFNDQAPLMQIEVGGFIERYDWISSVAFWYQYPPVASPEPLPPVADRVPPATLLMASEMTYNADPPLLVVPMEPSVLYVPGVDKGRIDFSFEAPEDGRYRLDGIFMYSLFGGVYQPLLDDEPIGQPVDFGARGMDPVWLPLDIHILKAGAHTIGFVGTGERSKFERALSPAKGALAVVGFRLMRLDTLEGCQQALKLELEKRAAQGK